MREKDRKLKEERAGEIEKETGGMRKGDKASPNSESAETQPEQGSPAMI